VFTFRRTPYGVVKPQVIGPLRESDASAAPAGFEPALTAPEAVGR